MGGDPGARSGDPEGNVAALARSDADACRCRCLGRLARYCLHSDTMGSIANRMVHIASYRSGFFHILPLLVDMALWHFRMAPTLRCSDPLCPHVTLSTFFPFLCFQ